MDQTIKKRLLRRLKILQGQLRGLENMVNTEQYCIDIIHQSLAIQESLGSLNQEMLKNHLQTHVVHQMKHGQERKAIQEMLSVCKLAHKI